MNSINIIGRLTKDAVVKENTAKGKIVTFTLADELRVNGEPVVKDGKNVVQYIDCAVQGKAVETAENLKKGAFVNGRGYLQVSRNKVGEGDDAKYYTNTTVWVNLFRDNKAKADEPEPADAEA